MEIKQWFVWRYNLFIMTEKVSLEYLKTLEQPKDKKGRFAPLPPEVKATIKVLTEEEVEQLKENNWLYWMIQGMRNPKILTNNRDPEVSRRNAAKAREAKKKKKLFAETLNEILDNPELMEKMLDPKNRPAWLEELEEKTGRNAMAAVQLARALKGNTRSYELLVNHAYGNEYKQTIELDVGENLMNKDIQIKIIEPKHEGLKNEGNNGNRTESETTASS